MTLKIAGLSRNNFKCVDSAEFNDAPVFGFLYASRVVLDGPKGDADLSGCGR